MRKQTPTVARAYWHFSILEQRAGVPPYHWVVGVAVDRPEMRWGPYTLADARAQQARLEAVERR